MYKTNAKTYWGDPYDLYYTHFITKDLKTEYEFVVVPEITYINSNQGTTQGQIINVLGNGFGHDAKKIEIKAGGLQCKI